MTSILSYSPAAELVSPSLLGCSTLLFDEVYDLDEMINEGCYGTVYKAYNQTTNQLVAVKIVHRVDDRTEQEVLKEVSLMYDLKGAPNVIQLVDFFMDDNCMYIVQDYAAGGDIIDQLMERGTFEESDASTMMRVLLQTVQALHEDYQIVHRDIKPDNMLLKDPTDFSSVQLCDFGFATYLPKSQKASLSRDCGSLAYVAPEIMQNKRYREQVDMWSIGCTLYLLLCGNHAFEDDASNSKTCANIKNCSYCNNNPTWNSISDEAKELIENLLVHDPKQRWTVKQALECDWMTKKLAQQ